MRHLRTRPGNTPAGTLPGKSRQIFREGATI